VEAVDHQVHRLDDQEIYGCADDEQREHPVDEITVRENSMVNSEVELAEVGLAEQDRSAG
jgi:hypothetical protein